MTSLWVVTAVGASHDNTSPSCPIQSALVALELPPFGIKVPIVGQKWQSTA